MGRQSAHPMPRCAQVCTDIVLITVWGLFCFGANSFLRCFKVFWEWRHVKARPSAETWHNSIFLVSAFKSYFSNCREVSGKQRQVVFLACFFVTFLFFCVSVHLGSLQHCEESQLKRARGNSHAERLGRLQGQPNSCRIHRQQFQRQAKRRVTQTVFSDTFIFQFDTAENMLISFESIFKSPKHALVYL